MALSVADRVKETTATTGTGTLTLAGAVTQFQSFAVVGNTNQCNYCILGGNGTDWETGIGTYTSSGTTLSRDVVLASSNSGSKISLTGTSTVFLTEPAAALRTAPTVPPPIAASWTQRGIASPATVQDVANGVQISELPASGSVTNNLRQLTLTAPATPYKIDMDLCFLSGVLSLSSDVNYFGAIFTDGTKIQTLMASIGGGGNGPSSILTYNFTNSTTTSGTVWGPLFMPLNYGSVRMQLRDDGTNITFAFSNDGVTWMDTYTVAKASGFLGSGGYTNVGFFADFTAQGSTAYTSYVTLKSWWVH